MNDEPDWVQVEIIGSGGVDGGPGPDAPAGSAGPNEPPRSPRSPLRTRWALGVLGAVVLVVAVTAVVRRAGQGSDADGAVDVTGSDVTASVTASATGPASARPTATASGTDGSAAESASANPLASYTPRTLPGAFARLQEEVTVYGFTAGAEHYPPTVMRLDLAHGVEVDTPLPALDSTGPVSVIALPDGVIVRPLDSVAGYQVQDGQPPSALRGQLANGGTALPGPVPGTVWVRAPFAQSGFITMNLVDETGQDLGRRITLGPDDGFPFSDGDGGIVVVRSGNRIVALADDSPTASIGPDGQIAPPRAPVAAEIGTGRLMAAGPTGYLYLGCEADEQCPLRYAGRDGRPLGSVDLPAGAGTVLGGVLSPDGSHAALSVLVPTAPSPALPTPSVADAIPASALVLINLAADKATLVPWINPNPQSGGQALAWLPDSSWLLVATGASELEAVAPDLDRGTQVGIVFVPYLTHLVVRPGS